MFDDLAASVASTLSGIFGGVLPYTRPGSPTIDAVDVPAVLRRDIELIDEQGQVVGKTHMLRIAHSDIAFVPLRDDYVESDGVTYTLGKRMKDDGYAYVFEVTT